jgi:pyridoxine 5-phosphate synthase
LLVPFDSTKRKQVGADRVANGTIRLGVNIDHVATVRQARGTRYPDPLFAAFQAAEAGADGITMHLREDRRHIQDRDVFRVREHVECRLNLEMAATDEMIAVAERLQPHDCCLVPERREELTTEGGLDVRGSHGRLSEVCPRLAAAGIQVSLFVDPDPAQIDAAAEVGAHAVEIHTGRYADAPDDAARARELDSVARAVRHGTQAGLYVHAGHGLHYGNVEAVAALAGVRELNIGHAIVARALSVGLPEAVAAMKNTMLRART